MAFSDHCFGEKHGVALWLRIWPAEDPTAAEAAGRKHPWIMWIHGGGYRAGNHFTIPAWVSRIFHHCHIVSVAYRFAPCVTMEDMVQDCHDAYRWCQTHLDELLADKGGCDVDSYILAGASAGAGLATLLPFRIDGVPAKAIIDVNGPVDFVVQQEHMLSRRKTLAPWSGSISLSEIRTLMEDHEPSHAVTFIANQEAGIPPENGEKGAGMSEKPELALKRLWGVPDDAWTFTERNRLQWELNGYIGSTGGLVSASLPLSDDLTVEDSEARMRRFSALYLLDTRPSYPPTIFIHGTADAVVPVQESQEMAKKLRSMGVAVDEVYLQDKGHGAVNRIQVSIETTRRRANAIRRRILRARIGTHMWNPSAASLTHICGRIEPSG